MRMDILKQIVASKRKELADRMRRLPLEQLKLEPGFAREPVSLKSALLNARSLAIIAEFKRRSPSRGWISIGASAGSVAAAYESSGAAGISVLTDRPFFGGNPGDLRETRRATSLPILRKDFMIDPYQIYEARAWGADAVLLIAAILTPDETLSLTKTAHELQLEVLLELHGEEELGYINPAIDLLGVNNRNLKTFEINTEVSVRMAAMLPAEIPRVSESGFNSPDEAGIIYRAGYHGLLIGEGFMKTPDPGSALQEFITGLKDTLA